MSDPKRILIVDDEPNVRLVFRTALASTGCDVAEAQDGESALRHLGEAPCDLVLLDLHMPVLDGMEVLGRLRERDNNVPVVIITAHGNVPNAVEAMKLGAIDFLAKPVSPYELRRVVTEVLERQHVARAKPGRADDVVTADSEFSRDLTRAKRALNARWFEEAEVFLKQAIGLRSDSAEAHNLMGVLHELRNQHDASYREYKAALKADRHYEPAKRNMMRYYERFTFGRSALPIDTGAE